MGDALDDEQEFLNEKLDQDVEPDWIVDENDSDESDQDEDDEAGESGLNKEAKKLKRKEKFKAMKEKKRQRLMDEEKDNVKDGEGEIEQLQLTPSESLELIENNIPKPLKMEYMGKLTAENFFLPALDPSCVTESKTKLTCPFVRALSASFPNYKKLFFEVPKNKEDYGSPLLLIVCSGAIRATEIIKSISSKLIKIKIAKLFSKHFKIEEQIEMLSKDYYPIAIGTPNRILKLIELGALSLARLKITLVDYTPDSKEFTLLTLPDTQKDFYQLLYGPIAEEKAHLQIACIRDQNKINNKQPVKPTKLPSKSSKPFRRNKNNKTA